MTLPYDILPAEVLAPVAAAWLARQIGQAQAARGVAHIALSGGSTPRALFRLLAEPAWQPRIDWARTHVWWVDERCVPPDHHDSNYGAAYTLLFQHLAVTQLHRIHGDLPPDAAADRYEEALRHVFRLGPRARPRFDFMLMGMGADGHTASLFPGSAALAERRRLATVGAAPNPPRQRVTLTLPVLNRAAFSLFLVAGADKGAALAQIFGPASDRDPLPAALVQPTRGRLLWLIDTAAAAAAGLLP